MWAVTTKYDDGRPIADISREQYAKGSMWLAFTKGMEIAQQPAAPTEAVDWRGFCERFVAIHWLEDCGELLKEVKAALRGKEPNDGR